MQTIEHYPVLQPLHCKHDNGVPPLFGVGWQITDSVEHQNDCDIFFFKAVRANQMFPSLSSGAHSRAHYDVKMFVALK